MIIKENPLLSSTEYQRISEIFELVNWGYRDPKEIKDAFTSSSFICVVYEKEKIIGFGRTFDDGKYYATICDVAIDPSFQKMGIGTTIVQNLQLRLEGFLFTTLTAAPEKHGFYEKLGWKRQISAFIWPIDSQQESDHC